MVLARGSFPRVGWIDGEAFTFLRDPQEVIERVKEYPLDVFTFLQDPERGNVFREYRNGVDTFATLHLQGFDFWWKNQCKYSVRKQVNKAARAGVNISETSSLTPELLETVHQIYNESPIRQGRKFPYYGFSLDRVRALTETFPQRSIFLEARFGDKIIGFIKMVTFGRTYAAILHILAFASERDKSPTNALIAEAVRACERRGISLLTYGRFAYGKKDVDGLLNFKLTHGFERLDVARYYVPLTRRGELGLALGLHRPLRERIPGWIVDPVLRLRMDWYSRKYGK